MRLFLSALLALSILPICGSGALAQATSSHLMPLQVTYQLISRQEGDCTDGNTGDCATVHIRQLEVNGGSPALRKAVDAWVSAQFLQALSGPTTLMSRPKTVEEAMILLFNDYQDHRAAFPDADFAWRVSLDVQEVYRSQQIFTLKLVHTEFLGSSHPNTWTYFQSFERQTGKMITVEDVVKEQDQVQRLAERYFRQQHDLSQAADLRNAGFKFPKNQFVLTQNFALTREGLLFHYNSYEVADEHVGATTLVIPNAELDGVVLR